MGINRETSANNLSLKYKLLDLVTSSWKSQAIYVAAELKIADYLLEAPKTTDELAEKTGTHARALKRLLSGLSSIEVFRQVDDDLFEITPMGKLLCSDSNESLRSWALWWGTNLWQTWGNLLYSVQTGESARKLISGKDGFDHLKGNSEAAEIFNNALVELTRLAAESIVNAYNFSEFDTVMDVGGGYGELLITILDKNLNCKGILFDLPHAKVGAKKRFKQAGLKHRFEFVEGDFFDSVPPGADAYILKSVIHDWNDEDSRSILENCRKAIKPDSRLLLAEQILPDKFDVLSNHQSLARSDLTMIAALGAGERTEAEFKALLKSSGFSVTKIVSAGPTFSVIEAEPA